MGVHVSVRAVIEVLVVVDDLLIGAVLPLLVVLNLIVDFGLVEDEASMTRLLLFLLLLARLGSLRRSLAGII